MGFILSVTFKFINYEKQRYIKPLCENGNRIYNHRTTKTNQKYPSVNL